MAGSNVALHVNNLFDREYVPAALTLMAASGAQNVRSLQPNLPFLISLLGHGFPCPFHKWLLCRNTRIIPIPLLHCVISLSCARAHAFASAVVNLSCREVTGLIGHNGSGKSTLLKMLAVISLRQKGRFFLMPSRWKAEQQSVCPQSGLFAAAASSGRGMTVRELVAIGRYPWHGALGALVRQIAKRSRKLSRWLA